MVHRMGGKSGRRALRLRHIRALECRAGDPEAGAGTVGRVSRPTSVRALSRATAFRSRGSRWRRCSRSSRPPRWTCPTASSAIATSWRRRRVARRASMRIGCRLQLSVGDDRELAARLLTGGEDYEILAAISPAKRGAVCRGRCEAAGVPVARVGALVEGNAPSSVLFKGAPLRLSRRAYMHRGE